MSQTKI